jgi:enoyl-CoA hydratase/carnithine racemase
MFDYIIASDKVLIIILQFLFLIDVLFFNLILIKKATFLCPFTKTGQSPEAASSYTFPQMMSPLKATEFLIFNRQLTANEAFDRNLVSEIVPHDQLQQKAWEKIESFSKLSKDVSYFLLFFNTSYFNLFFFY